MASTIGIDLGGTHLRAAVVSAGGRVTGAIRRPLPVDPDARRRAAVAAAVELLAAHPGQHIDAIGLAVAGTVVDGVLTWSASLDLAGVDHRAELVAATGRVTTVLNDARAAALAEAWHGAGTLDGARARTILMITVGTGIGGGIVIDGHPHHGSGHAGEVGHLPLDPRGPACRCGHRGCWERMAGGRALDAAAAAEAENRPDGATAMAAARDKAEATSAATAVTAADGAAARATAASLAAAADHGDRIAIAIIREHARRFARGLDGVCAVLAPDLVILGGGIIARPGPVGVAYLAAAEGLRWHRGQVRRAALGDDAGIIGAALAARQALPH